MKTFKIEGWYRYNDEKDFEHRFSNRLDMLKKYFRLV